LVIRKEAATEGKMLQLPDNPIVGTSSARRKALMTTVRPDAVLKDIRGNVPTRLQKLKDGQFDAILLAIAGINRLELDMSDFVMIRLNPKEFVPAPAQGVLTWQTKTDNMEVRRTLRKLHRSDVLQCTNVERKVLKLLDGGCHLPLGVYCAGDDMGYYHVCAILSGGLDQELTVVNLSSSTTKSLAETIFAQLKEGVDSKS
jgi:hydroxymethylbilane synthase